MNKTFKNRDGFSRLRIILTVIVFMAGIAVFFALQGKTKETIKIGAVLPITGPANYIGMEVRDGMLLAAAQIVNGKLKYLQ